MGTPVGLGTDLVEVQRIRDLLSRKGDAFKAKCFTDRERADAERSGEERSAERYAARFAAKEAVMKALGSGWSGGVGWTDIEIRTGETGAPEVVLSGGAADLAEELGAKAWLCSLTHTSELAAATAIALS